MECYQKELCLKTGTGNDCKLFQLTHLDGLKKWLYWGKSTLTEEGWKEEEEDGEKEEDEGKGEDREE